MSEDTKIALDLQERLRRAEDILAAAIRERVKDSPWAVEAMDLLMDSPLFPRTRR